MQYNELTDEAKEHAYQEFKEYMKELYKDLENAYEYEQSLDCFLEMVDYQDFNDDGSLS